MQLPNKLYCCPGGKMNTICILDSENEVFENGVRMQFPIIWGYFCVFGLV